MSEPTPAGPDATGRPSPDLPSAAAGDASPIGDDEQPALGAPRRTLRPTLPRFTLPSIAWRRLSLTGGRLAVVVAVASVVLGLAAFAAATVYAQYGAVKNEPNALAWGGLTPRFAGQAACTSCHEPEARTQDASVHAPVSCEGCHGPLSAHSASDAAARSAAVGKPSSDICNACHTAVAGRPADFPQIDRSKHYSGGQCLRCHDPHSIVAVRPPVVSHPRANLPACTTCHAPDGLKKIPEGHEPVADAVCLTCHAPGANGKR